MCQKKRQTKNFKDFARKWIGFCLNQLIKQLTKPIPFAREKTDLLNRPTSQKIIIEKDPLNCQIQTFMLFMDALAQEKYIQEVSL